MEEHLLAVFDKQIFIKGEIIYECKLLGSQLEDIPVEYWVLQKDLEFEDKVIDVQVIPCFR